MMVVATNNSAQTSQRYFVRVPPVVSEVIDFSIFPAGVCGPLPWPRSPTRSDGVLSDHLGYSAPQSSANFHQSGCCLSVLPFPPASDNPHFLHCVSRPTLGARPLGRFTILAPVGQRFYRRFDRYVQRCNRWPTGLACHSEKILNTFFLFDLQLREITRFTLSHPVDPQSLRSLRSFQSDWKLAPQSATHRKPSCVQAYS